ncbi:MAG: hypothetical protein WBB98_04550 [Xanthobacteraceae bacterium]
MTIEQRLQLKLGEMIFRICALDMQIVALQEKLFLQEEKKHSASINAEGSEYPASADLTASGI